MDNILDEIEQQQHFTDVEIFTQIWTRPRAVLKYIHAVSYDKFVPILLVLAGIYRAFDRAAFKGVGDDVSLVTIITFCIFLGGLLGWISIYIYAGLIRWTGQLFNGEGETSALLRILAYALFPSILSLLFLIPQIAIYGIEVFKDDGDIISAGLFSNIVFWSSMFIEMILAIFTIVFSVIGISIVQKIGIGKAILNLILPILVILVPIILIIIAVY